MLGVVGVSLMIKRSLWAFPVGLVAVSVQAVLFYQSHFPADAALQIFYFVMLAWGWRHWVRDRGAAPELPVTTIGWRARGLTLLAATAATVAAGKSRKCKVALQGVPDTLVMTMGRWKTLEVRPSMGILRVLERHDM